MISTDQDASRTAGQGGQPHGPRRRLRPAVAAAAVTAFGLVLAGCSSSSSSSSASSASSAAPASSSGTTSGASAASSAASSGSLSAATLAAIKASLKAAEAVPSWKAGGPAFSVKSLAGKKVFLLGTATNQFGASFIAGVTAAAKAAGMTATAAGSVNNVASENVQAVENAINAHASVIILLAIVPSTIAPALQKAKAAGIPVIETFIGDPQLPSAADKALGVYADATYCYSCTGQLAAEWEIAQTGGKVNSVVQQFPGQPPSDATAAGWLTTLKKYCPSTCTSSTSDLTFGSQTVQQIQTGAQVAAQNSAINAIFPVYDYQMAYMLPELTAASASSRINLLSENADLAQMQEMAQGTSVKVDVGNPVAWDGWAAVDQALRALKGLPPVMDEKLPVRLFSVDNIKSIDLSANPSTWFGAADYQLQYAKLWGAGA